MRRRMKAASERNSAGHARKSQIATFASSVAGIARPHARSETGETSESAAVKRVTAREIASPTRSPVVA